LTISPAWHEFVRLWAACRDPEGGIAHWPDAGGVGDQAAWLVDAFAQLARLYAGMNDLEKRRQSTM
jgi:hypothetical protein